MKYRQGAQGTYKWGRCEICTGPCCTKRLYRSDQEHKPETECEKPCKHRCHDDLRAWYRDMNNDHHQQQDTAPGQSFHNDDCARIFQGDFPHQVVIKTPEYAGTYDACCTERKTPE